MSRLFWVMLCAVGSALASLVGLIVVPNWQSESLQPLTLTDEGGRTSMYPAELSAVDEAPGRRIYVSQGCIYCHSQQVRAENFGADIARGWGERRSLPRDYLLQQPPLLGTMRTGPDLANIGVRQPSEQWHYLHLFDARLVSPGSVMPPFAFLFQVVTADPGAAGYRLPDDYFGRPSWILPDRNAQNLVAYLKTLHQDHTVAEVK